MFENIGRLSTRRSSKLAPDETALVSRSGGSARTTISSVMAPTSSAKGTVICCPTPSVMSLRIADL